MSKESFKAFAKNTPSLAKTVLNNDISWQQLYEIYEIYGEDKKIWNDIIEDKKTTNNFNDIINNIKKVDQETIQKGITSLQKTLSIFQDLTLSSKPKENTPQPLYRYFED